MGYTTLFLILFIILWMVLSTISIIDYLPHATNLRKKELFIFYAVFIFGGPIFAINQVLTTILESILPEGMDDNDLDKGY